MARGEWGGNLDTHPIQVRIVMRLGTSTCQTGFHLRRGGPNFSPLQDIANDVKVWVLASFKPLLLTTDRLLNVDAIDMYDGEGATATFTPAEAPGTAVGPVAPSFLMVPVAFKGEIRRRYGQGRGFWPVRTEDWTDGEILQAAGITAYQAAVTALVARYIGAELTTTYHLINAHRAIPARAATAGSPARDAIPASWYDVTTVRLSTALSALRSRKAGVGS